VFGGRPTNESVPGYVRTRGASGEAGVVVSMVVDAAADVSGVGVRAGPSAAMAGVIASAHKMKSGRAHRLAAEADEWPSQRSTANTHSRLSVRQKLSAAVGVIAIRTYGFACAETGRSGFTGAGLGSGEPSTIATPRAVPR